MVPPCEGNEARGGWVARNRSALDVQVNHPAPTQRHRLLPEVLEDIVSRAPRSEAEATVPEVLLVDTL